MKGTIKTLRDRGFGFIAIPGEPKDLFFHSKDLVGVAFEDLKEGDTVTFETETTPKGQAAVKVTRV